MPRLNGYDRLTAAQYREFVLAVSSVYDDDEDLDRAVLFTIGKPLSKVVNRKADLDTIVQNLIREADRLSWSAQLLGTFRSELPDDDGLLAFAQKFGLSPAAEMSSLEALVQAGDQLLDVAAWRARLGTLEAQVCRIEQDDNVAIGTGFLLAPDVVMTNYHVIEEVIGGIVAPTRIGVRFDYKARPDKVEVNSGQVYRLASTWDVAHSRYSDYDTQLNPSGAPGEDQLDYALIRIDGFPGDDPISGATEGDPSSAARGFVSIPPGKRDWTKPTGVLILQHPDGQPLKFAISTNANTEVLPANGTPTRVRYSTRTDHGSSGSPCFDINLNLIALHHSGDPKYDLLKVKAEWNEGIPISTIMSSLDAGARTAIGSAGP